MSAFIWCTVLGHVVGRNERLRLKLDNMAAKTTFARLYSLPELLLPVIIDLPDSFDSLLADLIADGYDLASLQPFLTG